MSKITTIITIILLCLSIFLGILTYMYRTTIAQTTKITQQEQQTAAIPQTQCALIISPEYNTTQAGKPASMNITIGSDGNYPTEIQLEMSYDPAALTNIQITPGDFLPNPKVLLNNIDTTTGRISYAITLPQNQKPINKSGTIATINFVPTGLKSDTQILFLPKTTVLSLKQPVILKQAEGADIAVSRPLNTASQSSQLNRLPLPKQTLFPTQPAK